MDAEHVASAHTRFACISIHESDTIRLLKFTQAEICAIKNIIEVSWPKPIKATRSISYAEEIKLTGSPWCSPDKTSDGTASRVLVRELLAYLFSRGWILTVPTAFTTRMDDGDTLIFREQWIRPPESEWLAIMFAGCDHLRVIGAPNDLLKAIRELLSCKFLLQEEKWDNRNKNSYDFKLRGSPWSPGTEGSVIAGDLILNMLQMLERFGWSLYASLEHNHMHFSEDDSKKDSWYCVKRVDWVRGSPVFHR